MFYAILGIFVFVALFLIFWDDHDKSYNKSEKGPQKTYPVESVSAPVIEPEAEEENEELDLSFLDIIDYFEDLEENTETFDVVGLKYHCTVQDCGLITGIVKPEPSNFHDNRAQAVIRNDGKLLGYIPRTQLDWYEEFNEQNVPCPFVGVIELAQAPARLIAEIKVIIPSSREFVEQEILEAQLEEEVPEDLGA